MWKNKLKHFVLDNLLTMIKKINLIKNLPILHSIHHLGKLKDIKKIEFMLERMNWVLWNIVAGHIGVILELHYLIWMEKLLECIIVGIHKMVWDMLWAQNLWLLFCKIKYDYINNYLGFPYNNLCIIIKLIFFFYYFFLDFKFKINCGFLFPSAIRF